MKKTRTYLTSGMFSESFSTLLEPNISYGGSTREQQQFLVVTEKQYVVRKLMTTYFHSGATTTTYVSENENFLPNSSIYSTFYNEFNYLKHAYQLINEKEINNFLSLKPELISPLIILQSEIFSRFGYVIPKMELVTDVELPEWKTLFFVIPFSEEYEIAFEKLNKLIREWLVFQSKDFKRNISISIR